jgi:hypothetical protein
MSYVHAPRNATYRAPRPASDKQTALIGSLAVERVTEGLAGPDGDVLAAYLNGDGISSSEASALITALFAAPRVAAASRTRVALPDVAAGHYAVEVDGVLKFFRIDRPTQGKWKGYTFVKVQASDDYFPVKGAAAKFVLESVEVDPAAAGERYGREIGRCYVCNRTLTDETSRALGIGPDCRSRR